MYKTFIIFQKTISLNAFLFSARLFFIILVEAITPNFCFRAGQIAYNGLLHYLLFCVTKWNKLTGCSCCLSVNWHTSLMFFSQRRFFFLSYLHILVFAGQAKLLISVCKYCFNKPR
jgi:hypothetical protein